MDLRTGSLWTSMFSIWISDLSGTLSILRSLSYYNKKIKDWLDTTTPQKFINMAPLTSSWRRREMPLTGPFKMRFMRWVVKPAILFLSLLVWMTAMLSMILLFTWKSLVSLHITHISGKRAQACTSNRNCNNSGLILTCRSTFQSVLSTLS